MKDQNYSNHTRYLPFLHYFVMPLALVLLFVQTVQAFLEPSPGAFIVTALIFLLICTNLIARLQSLTAQDRVIRLEEFLRYERILPADLVSKAKEIPVKSIVALRFASDEELPGLIQQVIDGSLAGSKEIKKAITNWKGDHYRV